MDDDYEPTPAASIIERFRVAGGVSARQAARDAGLSDGRWRQIAKGYQQAAKGTRVPVNTPPATLARMALAVGVEESALRDAGEGEVADELRALRASRHGRGVTFDVNRYEQAETLLREWLDANEEMHPPQEVLWLWTPQQLAENLAQQVAVLERAHEEATRAHFQALMQGKALPNREDGGEHGSAATSQADVRSAPAGTSRGGTRSFDEQPQPEATTRSGRARRRTGPA